MLRVAAAVIRREGKILLARRAPHKSQAGLWEFPGGKIEPGETPAACLVRELKEELGLAVTVGPELARTVHAYDFGEIELIAHDCACETARIGASTDHDAVEWVAPEKLTAYALAPADIPIAERLAARCVAVVVRSGMALLVRVPGSPLWEFPSGPVAPGEKPESAAVRLLREAVGVEAAPGAVLAREGGAVAVLIKSFTGALDPTLRETCWIESRRLLEKDLTPAIKPFAELVASHRRRDRYTGTHPKSFAEKYKELSGDPEAMAKAAARGSTPAGAHLSIMVPEILQALSPLSNMTILDCTLGWGGHAEALAKAAGQSGMVIGLDRDGEELARTEARLKSLGLNLIARQSDYADALAVLKKEGLTGVDCLLADLGVSSMQLDRPERGMSFKTDGPLDMRMDRSTGMTAAEWLAEMPEARVAEVLSLYGDEPDAAKIAAALKKKVPQTTRELSLTVAAAKGLPPDALKKKSAFSKHPAVRVFQALRIAVNDERASLERLLADLPKLLRPGGRVALLTFHSGEERLVEKALKAQSGLWEKVVEPRKASAEEVNLNPRARSARLWTVVRV